MKYRHLLLIGLLAIAVLIQAQGRTPVDPLALRIGSAGLHAQGPLSTVLSQLGLSLETGYIVFGVDVALRGNGEEPYIDLELNAGNTLGDAIQSLKVQLPDYEWKVVSNHLLNVYPSSPAGDKSILDVCVSAFSLNEYPERLFINPQAFMPELQSALAALQGTKGGTGGYGGSTATGFGPAVALQLRDMTIRDIFNATSDAMISNFPANQTPLGWVHLITTQTTSGFVEHSWKAHVSVNLANWNAAIKRPVAQPSARGRASGTTTRPARKPETP